MNPYRFAIVGAGWRAEFFFRIAQALPERFRIEGLVVRDAEKGRRVEERWGHRTFRALPELLDAVQPEFLVGSVSYAANYAVNRALLETGLPVLSETPPAATLEQMRELWELAAARGARFQVAEQFHRQPHHAARLAAVRAGRIGRPHKAYLSVCHGYHGTSLIRHFLGVGFEEARIVGMEFRDRVLDPGGRDGPPAQPEVKELPQQVALLDFGDGRQAVFDFVGAQYFSPIRTQRLCIRGERGEIVDHTLYVQEASGRGMVDGPWLMVDDRQSDRPHQPSTINHQPFPFHSPLTLPFQRHVAGANGNLEGFYLKGIQLGEEWVYRNPTAPARLSDEEIAMADILQGMGEYARGGPEVYPLRDAMQDHYLGLRIKEATETGERTTAVAQPWAR